MDALVRLDTGTGTGTGTLTDRLTAGLREAVRSGRLAAGTRLPSTRTLAGDLGVSRGLVVEAYEQLVAEGFLVSRRGSGTRVAPDSSAGSTGSTGPTGTARAPAARGADGEVASRAGREPAEDDYDLWPGTPDLAAFPRAAWLAALRHALTTVPNAALGYGDPAGVECLRVELAAYLGRVRAVAASPDRILVLGGVAEALSLVGRVLVRAGHGWIAVEDPSGAEVRRLLADTGLRVVGVPVDAEGVDVAALARSDARAVLLTPAHQFPTGVVLSPHRRSELVAWARDVGGLVLEDDYDAEFRYDRDPVGCLQGLAPDQVAHLGSLSKSLAPGLRLGWAVLPRPLVEPVRQAKHYADYCSPVLDQFALARLLASGAYDRHLRAARRRYRARRDALVSALAERLPEVTVHGVAAGLHVYVELPRGCDEAAVVSAAAQRGLRLAAVAPMRFARAATAEPAVVLGYAKLGERRLTEVAAVLAGVVRQSRASSEGSSPYRARSKSIAL